MWRLVMEGSCGRLPTLIPPVVGSLEAGAALGHGHEDVYGSERALPLISLSKFHIWLSPVQV